MAIESAFIKALADYLLKKKETETDEPIGISSWVSESDGNIPRGAVHAGKINNEDTYVARVKYDGKWVPGQLIPSKKKCIFLCDGDVFSKAKYEVLCYCTAAWNEMTDEISIPRRALHIDGSEPAGKQSFIGRVVIGEDVFLGEVHESDELLNISHSNLVQSYDHYEILVLPTDEIAELIKQEDHDNDIEVTKKHEKVRETRSQGTGNHSSDDQSSHDNRRGDSNCVTDSEKEYLKKRTMQYVRQRKQRQSSSSERSERESRQHSRRKENNSSRRRHSSKSASEGDSDTDIRRQSSHRGDKCRHKHVTRRHQTSDSEEEVHVRTPRRKVYPSSEESSDGQFSTRKATWVQAENGAYPRNAVVGGTNHIGKVFVARASHNGAVLPGKLIPKYKTCYISVDGEEIRKRKYEVLCNMADEEWIAMTSKDSIPSYAVLGGYNHERDDVFIGRVLINKSYINGRIERVNGKYRCLILLQQQEESQKNFEILIQKINSSNRVSLLHNVVNVKKGFIQRSATFSERSSPNVTTHKGSWEEAENGAVPSGAVIGGCNEQGDVFVARGIHDGSILPGKLLPSRGYFFTCCPNGKEVRLKNYQVLCNCDAKWQHMSIANGDTLPKIAIPGGVTSTNEPLYIGRVHHSKGNGITCGMVDKTSGICTVVYGKKGHEYQDYEILVLTTAESAHLRTSARLGKQIAATIKKKSVQKPQVADIKQGLKLFDLKNNDPEYIRVADLMKNTIRQHGGNIGGVFTKYNISKIEKIEHGLLKKRYNHYADVIKSENGNNLNEKTLFHGSPFWKQILENGFDERKSTIDGMFGAGIYFAEHSSKSNQYVFGFSKGNKCPQHQNSSCYVCDRHLILCNVALGKTSPQQGAFKVPHAPPGHHSVTGVAGANLKFAEFIVYRGEQVLATHLVTYKIEK